MHELPYKEYFSVLSRGVISMEYAPYKPISVWLIRRIQLNHDFEVDYLLLLLDVDFTENYQRFVSSVYFIIHVRIVVHIFSGNML